MKTNLEIWLQFISNIFKYLTWPMLILTIILFFKTSITDLLKKLSKFSGKGLEFEFKSDLDTVTTELFDNELKDYSFHSKELKEMSKMTLDYPKASIQKAICLLIKLFSEKFEITLSTTYQHIMSVFDIPEDLDFMVEEQLRNWAIDNIIFAGKRTN